METLFSIVFSEKFKEGVGELFSTFLSEKDVSYEFVADKKLSKININGNNIHKGSYRWNQLTTEVSRILESHIVKHIEEIMVKDIIKKEYLFEGEDNQKAYNYFKDYNRNYFWSTKIFEHFQNQSILNIEGLIRFKSKDYVESLGEYLDFAVDELVMDKQYEEFLSLLKYFVYIQEPKADLVHVNINGEDFEIFDKDLKPITQVEDESKNLLLDADIHVEDMLVSSLITLSPQHIFVYTNDTESMVVKTITTIFEDRVNISKRAFAKK